MNEPTLAGWIIRDVVKHTALPSLIAGEKEGPDPDVDVRGVLPHTLGRDAARQRWALADL